MNNVHEAFQNENFHLLYLEPIQHIKTISDLCPRESILVYEKSAPILSKRIASDEIECIILGFLLKYRDSSLLPTNICGAFGWTEIYADIIYS